MLFKLSGGYIHFLIKVLIYFKESDSSDSDSEDEGNVDYKTYLATTEVPPEFWQVIRMFNIARLVNVTYK